MASVNSLTDVFIWIVGILVSLAVGSGMIKETLTVPGIPSTITVIAGWIVIITTIIGVVLALVDAAS